MLISGLVNIQDLNKNPGRCSHRPVRSCVMSKKENGEYYVSVKNSNFPNCINYKVSDLKQLHCNFIDEGRLGMRFKQPEHLLLVLADSIPKLKLFLKQIKEIANGKNVAIGTRNMPKTVPPKEKVVNRYDPLSTEFVAIECFDKRVLNMRQLNKLVLENCTLSSIPLEIGNLPISYLSLSGSKLSEEQYHQDIFWDWMSIDTIENTLKTLKMNSIGLKKIPFEIRFLKNLEALYVANNNLEYIPHYVGELKKLLSLFVADNKLSYFPDSLYFRTFIELDISDNRFGNDSDHISAFMNKLGISKKESQKPDVKNLIHLSFASVVQNCIKIKRQEIPRNLWPYFDVVGRCTDCDQYVLPQYSKVHLTCAAPSSVSLIKTHVSNSILWLTVFCYCKCLRYANV